VVQIEFDPYSITFDDLLQVFFQTHDPTTPNRQGNDIGTQYRSIIYYHNSVQRETALATIKELTEAVAFPGPIVTLVEPAGAFYPAEDYHQNYFAAHPEQAYCASVIRPKVDKFRKKFHEFLQS
jgi:peptide-methionine (S)-S-oxide reductase